MFLLLLTAVVSPVFSAEATDRLTVFTSILPQKFFVEQIAGDLAEVEVLVGPGMSPHTYEPLPMQMSRLSRAAMFFCIGVPFEKVLKQRLQSICPDMKIVDTDKGVERRIMRSHIEEPHHDHAASESCSHASGEPDPHVWLDPENVLVLSQNIALALKEALPDKSTIIDERLASFSTKLGELIIELDRIMEPVKGETMLVFHPAFGYFAERFGLEQESIEIEGKEPAPRQLAEIIRKCRAENIHIIFVQKQFPVAAAKSIADAIDGAVVQIDPLAEDYFASLKSLAVTVSEGLKKK